MRLFIFSMKMLFIYFFIITVFISDIKSQTNNKPEMFEKDNSILRIVTWNLKMFFDSATDNNNLDFNRSIKSPTAKEYRDKLKKTTDILNEINADIICLQEVEMTGSINNASNPLKNLTDALSKKSGYKYDCYILSLPNYSTDKPEINCAFIYKTQALKLQTRMNVMSDMSKQYGISNINRHIYGQFKFKNEIINIFNIHLPRPDGELKDIYKICLLKANAVAAYYSKQGYHSILIGDFNLYGKTINESEKILSGKHTKIASDDFIDIFNLDSTIKSKTHKIDDSRPDRIYISNSLNEKNIKYARGGSLSKYYLKKYDSDWFSISDHFPVFADFKIGKNK